MLWRPRSTGVSTQLAVCATTTLKPPDSVYPVVLRRSQESRRQEVAQLGKQRKSGPLTGRDISLLVSKTGSNEPPLRWAGRTGDAC